MAIFNVNGVLLAVSPAGYQTLTLPSAPSGYDLDAAVAAVPFTVNLPTAPTITSEATCDTEAEITASVAVDGRRTIVAPGSYTLSTLSIGGSDKHIVFQPGASFALDELQLSGARIQIDDAVITSAGQYGLRFNAPQDVRFNRLDLDAADGG